MNEPPVGLDETEIVQALDEHWGIAARDLEHLAVGFGGWHWRVDAADSRCWFVTADKLDRGGHSLATDADDVFATLSAAYGTAVELRAAGLEFALAPVPTVIGLPLQRVSGQFALSVTPFLDGDSGPGGTWPDPQVESEVAAMAGRLHAVTPPAAVPRWEPGVPHRAELLQAMRELERPWRGGPYSESARHAVAAAGVRVCDLLRRHDELFLPALAVPWAVTHGEVHSANVLRTGDGRVLLVDWDTVALAPRERDLWSILPDTSHPAWPRYVAAYGDGTPPSVEGIELRKIWWATAEIAEYVCRFRRSHDGGADDDVAWKGLQGYLAG
ncbi:MAG: phosphotransferase [Mycobacteriales bacterium]